MTDQWWSDDDRLLGALDGALRTARDVPRHFIEAGQASYTWHGIDAELAALTYDSATEELSERVLATRAEPAPLRAMTFATADLTIELEVTNDGLLGQIVPSQPGEIELRLAGRTVEVVAIDEVGWFSFHPTPSGTFRLECRMAAGGTVTTDWISL